MKSRNVWLLVVLGIAIGAGGGFWFGHRGAAGGKEPDPSPGESRDVAVVAGVSVTPIRLTAIAEEITAYGTVVAPTSEVRVVSVPFESHVTKMLATPGEMVSADQPLIEVEGSAGTALALEEARNAEATANRDLQLVRQRFEQKLATNSDLSSAESALRTAQGRLQSLQTAGAGGPRMLTSEVAGVVSKVDVQIGQVVAIGSPLVEVAALNRIEVKLGIEPADVAYLKPGQEVQLHRVADAGAPAVNGKIRLIGQRVDPTTRLVDVLVSLPPDAKLMLEGFVVGQLTKVSAEAMVVPRDAVLPDEGGYTLYTVKAGKAVKHSVRIGLENDRDVQVVSDGLHQGDPAVVVGNYELQDGVSVEVRRADTKASTAPTTTGEVAR